jgi:hypothetical protein
MTTAAITAPQITTIPTTTVSPINESLFNLKNVITTLFIATIMLITSALWGLPFGLVASSACLALMWSFQNTSEPLASLPQELHLDSTQEILPTYRDMRPHQVSEGLSSFVNTVFEEINRQSLHYESAASLPSYMLDHFPGMDFSRLTLLGVKPIRFIAGGEGYETIAQEIQHFAHLSSGEEGYEIVARSEEPPGWFHLCMSNRGNISARRGDDCRFTRIPQVTPFLTRDRLGERHFMNLPFPFRRGVGRLMVDICGRFRGIDLCQVELRSWRRVRFDLQDRQQEPSTPPISHTYNGYEIDFHAPFPGPMCYYIDEAGEYCAYDPVYFRRPCSVQNIVPL